MPAQKTLRAALRTTNEERATSRTLRTAGKTLMHTDITATTTPESNKTTDALDLLRVLKRRKWNLLISIFVGVALSVIYYVAAPRTFRAEIELLVGQKSGNVVRGASDSPSVEGVQAEEDILSTHIQLFRSRRILQSALDSAELTEIPSIKEAIAKGGSPIKYLKGNLKVMKGGDGVARDAHTLRATYDDPSPTNCAVILRAIYGEYEKYQKEHFEGTSSDAVDLLEKIVGRNAAAVFEAEEELIEFMSSTDVTWNGEQSRNHHKDRLEQIDELLLDLTQTHVETESRLAVISEFLQDKAPEDITDVDRLSLLSEKEVNRLQLVFAITQGDFTSETFQAEQPLRQESARAEYNEYLNLVMREQELRAIYVDDHPKIALIKEQLDLMRQLIAKNAATADELTTSERMSPAEMLETYQGLLQHDLDETLMRRKVLMKKRGDELKLAKALEADEMKANSMKSEIRRRQDLHERSQDTMNELSVVRDYAGFSTDVIGEPLPQDKHVWPNLKIVCSMGLFLGGAFGLVLVLMAEVLDATFRDPDDLSRSLQLPIYAHVPHFPLPRLGRGDLTLELDPSIYLYHRPRSAESEMYRVIRTKLFRDIRVGGQRVIQITSASRGEGKSTTAANLAVAIANTGKTVLLVDGELRNPQVANLMRLDQSPGFAEVLRDQVEPSEAIQPTVVKNLWAVAAGQPASHPAELLENTSLKSIIDLWRDEFDYVIIDSPSILAVSDASIIANVVDGIVFTTRIRKYGRAIVETAKDFLDTQGIPVLGIVVNGYSSKSGKYGYANAQNKNLYGYGDRKENAEYYNNSAQKAPAAAIESRTPQKKAELAPARITSIEISRSLKDDSSSPIV